MSTLTRELAAAVEARARARLLRRLRAGESSDGRPARSLKKRIERRADGVSSCLDKLRQEARVLIANRSELGEVLAALDHIDRSFARHIAAHHDTHDLPPYRPSDERPFRAECQRIMKAHKIGATQCARIIAEQIAPNLPGKARAELLGPWLDTASQIARLADRLRPRSSARRRIG